MKMISLGLERCIDCGGIKMTLRQKELVALATQEFYWDIFS